MKLVKLSELGSFKNGLNFTNVEVTNPCKIIGVADFQTNVFPNYSNLKTVDDSVVTEDFLLQENDIVFVRSNGNKELVGRIMLIENLKERITFSGFCIRFRPDASKIDPKYLFYMLKSNFCKKQYSYSQQTNITNLSQDILNDVKVPIFDDFSQNINLLYDLDLLIHQNKMLLLHYEKLALTLFDYNIQPLYDNNKSNKKVSDLATISVGTKYANYADETGKYRYFTCSKDILWCKEYEFVGKSIIIATHGDFYVDHYDGKFNAYFCNAILSPLDEKYYALIYYTISKNLPKLRKQASGSVIKFISNDDLMNIDLYIPSDEVLSSLNEILKYKQAIIDQNISYNKMKEYYFELLLNGQAIIVE